MNFNLFRTGHTFKNVRLTLKLSLLASQRAFLQGRQKAKYSKCRWHNISYMAKLPIFHSGWVDEISHQLNCIKQHSLGLWAKDLWHLGPVTLAPPGQIEKSGGLALFDCVSFTAMWGTFLAMWDNFFVYGDSLSMLGDCLTVATVWLPGNCFTLYGSYVTVTYGSCLIVYCSCLTVCGNCLTVYCNGLALFFAIFCHWDNCWRGNFFTVLQSPDSCMYLLDCASVVSQLWFNIGKNIY